MSTVTRMQDALIAAGVRPSIVSIDIVAKTAVVQNLPFVTDEMREDAAPVIEGFDWSVEADEADFQTKEPDLAAVRKQAAQAIADINAFLAIPAPTNPQVLAEVRAIDQRQRGIIKAIERLSQRLYDSDRGTLAG